MNWPIFTRILPLINVFKWNTQAYDRGFKSNYVSKNVVGLLLNNVLIRNYIMLVRHLMLEVNKGWRFRDVFNNTAINTKSSYASNLYDPWTLKFSFKLFQFWGCVSFVLVWSPADELMRTHVGVLSQLKKHLLGYVTQWVLLQPISSSEPGRQHHFDLLPGNWVDWDPINEWV